MKTTILKNEFWYGGAVYEGYRQPVGADDIVDWDFRENPTHNQIMPLFLSSKGRYIWSNAGFHISFQKGEILAEGPESIVLENGFNDLRGAYLAAMKAHFPFHEIKLSDRFFKAPVYNSWIELTYYQTQENILKYAKGILENGFPSGVLMIDDGWSPYYGRWQFRGDNFKDAKAMIKELHEMGFSVMLWICPFVTPDTLEFRKARDKHFLIETPEGKPRILEWWNGYSAALDLTNPDALKWLKNQLDVLMDMGVDGFKLDAGDPCYYHAGDKLFRDASTDELSRLWAEFGEQFVHGSDRIFARRRLTGEHDGARAVIDRVGNVGNLRPRRARIVDHGFEHFRGRNDALAEQTALGNEILLDRRQLRKRNLHAQIAPADHNAGARLTDLFHVVNAGLVLDLGDDLHVPAAMLVQKPPH